MDIVRDWMIKHTLILWLQYVPRFNEKHLFPDVSHFSDGGVLHILECTYFKNYVDALFELEGLPSPIAEWIQRAWYARHPVTLD